MKRECGGYQVLKDAGHLVSVLNSAFLEKWKSIWKSRAGKMDGTRFWIFIFRCDSFLNMYERVDEHYRIYTELLPSGEFVIRLYCVNPIENLAQCLSQGKAAVFFSATLLPVQYYISLLSEAKDDYAIYARSPFDPKNRAVLIGTDVSSRYTRRGQEEYMRIAAYIKQTVMQKREIIWHFSVLSYASGCDGVYRAAAGYQYSLYLPDIRND